MRCAEAVLKGTTLAPHAQKIGCDEKIALRVWLKNQAERICSVAGYRGAERAEARGVLELETVFSCRSGDHRWGTKLDFGSGEPFDDLHSSSTLGTAIKIRSVFGSGGVFFSRRFLCRTQQLEAKRQKRGAPTVGQEAEVADAHETFRKDVQ